VANGSPLQPPAERPPYRIAAAVAAAVLVGYILSLAPTVTLWDAGEFITAAHTLGIPHPPGTPLFVIVGHVWGLLVAIGGYAWRLNLLSAVCSAAAAGFVFLAAHRVLAAEAPLLRTLGGAAAALISAFTFTVWQNSNETEVYAIAMFMIGAILWLSLRWRDTRSPRYLLLIAYIMALSIGNHLLALLAGPAVIVFVALTLRGDATMPAEARRAAWAEWIVFTTVWALLVAVGLGKTSLFWVATLLVAGAVAWAAFSGAAVFGGAVLAVALIGVSTYAFLYIRAGLDPILNEADPSTWQNLLAVIQRAQYPPRSPLDNPLFESGRDNPGRTITLMSQQLVNYIQYFDWQWSRSLALGVPAGQTPRLVFTLLFVMLGVTGISELKRRDNGSFALLGTLWLATGLGLVAYMNFKPGFSLFWDQYRSMDQHEVRERDYFFIASFQAWGVFAGLGLAVLARRLGAPAKRYGFAVLALALVPITLNWRAAGRRHGPDAFVARDFAYNLLQSVGPYGILFTYGDNDTFPVWYLQEVEGVRQDVVLVNLSLANTDWYLDQMRRWPVRPFDRAAAPPVWRDVATPAPTRPVLDIPDSVARELQPFRQPRDESVSVKGLQITLRANQTVLPRDLAIFYILAGHFGTRPIAFGATSGAGEWLGLDRYVVQRGLAQELVPEPEKWPHTIRGVQGMVDTLTTRILAADVFRYSRLIEADTLVLEPAARQVTSAMARPWLELAQAAILRHNQAATIGYLRRAVHLMPNPQLAALLHRIETEGLDALTGTGSEPPQRP
jgi:transmembrane protein TMEM260 (protein O-mannosyltransferase)